MSNIWQLTTSLHPDANLRGTLNATVVHFVWDALFFPSWEVHE